MAYTTINKSTDYFNTLLYTGNGSNGHAITGVGFQPDWTWIKDRDTATNHMVTDAVRGATKTLHTQNQDAESTAVNALGSFNTDGFTVNTDTDLNANNKKCVAWNWKAGTGVSGNTTGSGSYKTYTGSVSTISGISIIKYTGNGSAGHTIPHHLGAVPKLIIVKELNNANDWKVYSSHLTNAQSIRLDTNGSYDNDTPSWNSTTPTSSVFTVGTSSATNRNDSTYIAYSFIDIQGYSKCGSYIGNGNANGTFIYTGFKPAFVMIKNTTTAGNWGIIDNKRPGYNQSDKVLKPNTNEVEATGWGYHDLLSNGFKHRGTDVAMNASDTYIYLSFGQSLVGSNKVPCTAR